MRQINKVLLTGFILLSIFLQPNNTVASSITFHATATATTSKNLPAQYLKAGEFVKLSAKDFGELTGKKLNFFQRLSFGITKLRVKHDLKKNPDLQLTDYNKSSKGSFNFLWFILGLAGPIIGLLTGSLLLFILLAVAPVAIAYATRQDKVKIKSVWIGFGISLSLILILGIIVVASFIGAF